MVVCEESFQFLCLSLAADAERISMKKRITVVLLLLLLVIKHVSGCFMTSGGLLIVLRFSELLLFVHAIF